MHLETTWRFEVFRPDVSAIFEIPDISKHERNSLCLHDCARKQNAFSCRIFCSFEVHFFRYGSNKRNSSDTEQMS